MAKQNRNSVLELMRILCIISIVYYHYSAHGFEDITTGYCGSKYLLDLLTLGPTCGVDGFILVSGYYMAASEFKAKKLLRIAGQVWFYSAALLLVFLTVLTPVYPITVSDIVKSLLPVSYNRYWFATAYIMLMLFSPFLNRLIRALNREELLRLIAVLVLLWSALSTLFSMNYAYNTMGWFVTLYLIAGYIRLYHEPGKERPSRHLIGMIIWFMPLLISDIALLAAGKLLGNGTLIENARYFVRENGVFALGMSIEMFLLFLNLKPFYSKVVNTLASATFGVYLLHENPLLRPYIWIRLCRNSAHYGKWAIVPHALIAPLLVYFACAAIELVRIRTVEKLWLRAVDAFLPKLEGSGAGLCERALGAWRRFAVRFYGKDGEEK